MQRSMKTHQLKVSNKFKIPLRRNVIYLGWKETNLDNCFHCRTKLRDNQGFCVWQPTFQLWAGSNFDESFCYVCLLFSFDRGTIVEKNLVQTLASQLSSSFPQGFIIVFCLQVKAGHHFTIGLEYHQMESRRLNTKHQSKMSITGHRVTKLSQEFIESFTMTSIQMQTRLKTYHLKVSNYHRLDINI
jgi:hypothetical protein